MAKGKNKGSNETRKPKKDKGLDMRPHEVRKRSGTLNGGTAGGAQDAAARG